MRHVTFIGVAALGLSAVFSAEAREISWLERAMCPVPQECKSNSIDAHCSIISCVAKVRGCTGDRYKSGDCKDLKDVHDAASCGTIASSNCGQSLPAVLPTRDIQPQVSPPAVLEDRGADEDSSPRPLLRRQSPISPEAR